VCECSPFHLQFRHHSKMKKKKTQKNNPFKRLIQFRHPSIFIFFHGRHTNTHMCVYINRRDEMSFPELKMSICLSLTHILLSRELISMKCFSNYCYRPNANYCRQLW
jgi:hypothetical protein